MNAQGDVSWKDQGDKAFKNVVRDVKIENGARRLRGLSTEY